MYGLGFAPICDEDPGSSAVALAPVILLRLPSLNAESDTEAVEKLVPGRDKGQFELV